MVIDLNQHYQPYYRAFILHEGYQTGDDVPNWVYLNWNNCKWTEWCRLRGKTRHQGKSRADHEDFEQWLFDTVPANTRKEELPEDEWEQLHLVI